MFAIKKRVPMDPPNSGPKALLIMKYAPPPSMAPFVEMAQMDRTVKNRMTYAKDSSKSVKSSPECPKMYPTRRKRIAENIERQTGVKTPLKVVRDRTEKDEDA